MDYHHVPVLLPEILEAIVKKRGVYIDCTLGGAAYTLAIAKKIKSKSRVIAIDADKLAIDNAKKIIDREKINNVVLVHDNFSNLEKIAAEYIDDKVAGIVFDLGLSSAQLDDQGRGFSFLGDRPLDMSFGPNKKIETVDIVNSYSLADLTRIFKEYGDEPRSYQMAKLICQARKDKKINSTKELINIIEKAISVNKFRKSKINPLTKVFQALRIETNDEINNLKIALEAGVKLLDKGSKIAVVSFHSGEDRVVKNYFRRESKGCICPASAPLCACDHRAILKIINKKPILASVKEVQENPRSRSAKLRIAEKI